MPAYRFAFPVRSDLRSIRRYIAHDNPRAADRVIESLRTRFAMLARQPLIGEPRDEIRTGLRSFPVGNYVIYYVVEGNRVQIERVLHGARDVESQFGSP